MAKLDKEMMKLLLGANSFSKNTFTQQKSLFDDLSKGQDPCALFICCSDSRLVPNLITHTDPGDLFCVRNAGNIVPSESETSSGESTSIRFAVEELKVRHVIVCGHSLCGAVTRGLDGRIDLNDKNSFFHHMRVTGAGFGTHVSDPVSVAAQANVLAQLEHLRTYRCVSEGVKNGKLRLSGWLYEIETGTVHVYDEAANSFAKVDEFLGGESARL